MTRGRRRRRVTVKQVEYEALSYVGVQRREQNKRERTKGERKGGKLLASWGMWQGWSQVLGLSLYGVKKSRLPRLHQSSRICTCSHLTPFSTLREGLRKERFTRVLLSANIQNSGTLTEKQIPAVKNLPSST